MQPVTVHVCACWEMRAAGRGLRGWDTKAWRGAGLTTAAPVATPAITAAASPHARGGDGLARGAAPGGGVAAASGAPQSLGVVVMLRRAG